MTPTSVDPIALKGAPGSPYTRKVLGVLRYRRIPYRYLIEPRDALPAAVPAKVPLLPTFYVADERGTIREQIDSTPIIRWLERQHSQREVVPADPALAFLDYLLEDFADEWLTKAMFHYRWAHTQDAEHAARILPLWRAVDAADSELSQVRQEFAARQIGRLYVVGSNDTTAPVIERSYRRMLNAMETLLEARPFIMGSRPGASDFAFYGQLTQLVHFDPTPRMIALDLAPRTFAWVDLLEDLSGLEPRVDDWLHPDDAMEALRPLLAEVGRYYVPVLLANADAVSRAADWVDTTVDGQHWRQRAFPYQAKCLSWIREQFTRLDDSSRRKVSDCLSGTQCEALLHAR